MKLRKSGTYADAKRNDHPQKTISKTDFLMKKKVMNSPTCVAKKIMTGLNKTGI